MSARPGTSPSAIAAHARAVAALAAAGCGAYGLYQLQVTGQAALGWWSLLAALVLATGAQLGLCYPAPALAPAPLPAPPPRRAIGLLVALGGAVLWGMATKGIYENWQAGFDFAWMGWAGGATLLAVGLDLAWGRWPRREARRWTWPILALLLVLVVVAGVYRLGNIRDFPGEAAITQIEDLQVGSFGWAYLKGYRLRWEYLSSTWLAALGLWWNGPSQFSMRVPFAVVSALKVLPLFVWLRLMVGTGGALVGAALLTFSFWDVTLSRIPNNHNALIVATVFALLAGPVRRGRPSGYVFLGFFGAYVLHEYVAYRPLAALAVAGAVLYSLRDHAAGWMARLARPALTVALLLTMVTPLFHTRIPGPLRIEYFDGWNRAKGITGYYNSADSWEQSIARRVDRFHKAAVLFTVQGDSSPVRNIPGQPPLIHPFTCVLLVLGMGGALAHALHPVFGLTLLGLLVTVAGTLVMTGNFDVARVGGAVPYVYALAGVGAASLLAALTQAWGRIGRVLMLGLLAAGVAGAGWWCTRNLIELWTNPVIRGAHRNNLAYLTVWVRQHVRPGERVLGIAGGLSNVLEMHDGGWLRGEEIPGFVTWDIETALRQWQREPGPTLLFISAGPSTAAVATFLESLIPELEFEIDPDPLDRNAEVAYARLPGPPPELARRLAEWHCRGVHAEFTLVGTFPKEVLYSNASVAPFICRSAWPASVPETLYRLHTRPQKIRVHYATPFTITVPGSYRFALPTYAGTATLAIDGQRRDIGGETPVELGPGLHQLEVNAEFAPMAIEPNIRLLWSGPETGNRQELMPLYKLAPIDPSCPGGGATAGVPARAAPSRRYLTAWLGRGPFNGSGDLGARENFLDVAQLSTAPAPAPGWNPIQTREAFIDLDALYSSTPPQKGAVPHWVCAYTATTISAPSARDAYLEIAGSDDPLRVWLNGRELTSGPLTIGSEPRRRPIELNAGPNLLVVQSCDLLGAWYFAALVTDAEGTDLADLEYAAALPEQPLPPPAGAAALEAQMVEGFGALVQAPHHHAAHRDYRGAGESWFAYVQDEQPEVEWRSAPVPQKQRTVVAVTASTSFLRGEAELIVDGRSVLGFKIGDAAVGGTWEANGYRAAFLSRPYTDDNSGIFVISIPPEAVTPGQPLDLRVRLTGGAPEAWFMIKGYPDTVSYEQLAGVETQTMRSAWEPVPAPGS